MKYLITTLGTLAAAVSLSLAQDAPAPKEGGKDGERHQRPNPEDIFKKLDSNSDGAISLEEFKAGRLGQKDPAKAEEIYKKMDKDSDGKVTLDEFKSHRPSHAPGGRGGKGGKGGDKAPEAPAKE